jgi:hypothetical protein
VQLEYRHNEVRDTVLFVDDGKVKSVWTVDRPMMESFCNCSQNASDWDDHGWTGSYPDEFGKLLASRQGYALTSVAHGTWIERVRYFCH